MARECVHSLNLARRPAQLAVAGPPDRTDGRDRRGSETIDAETSNSSPRRIDGLAQAGRQTAEAERANAAGGGVRFRVAARAHPAFNATANASAPERWIDMHALRR